MLQPAAPSRAASSSSCASSSPYHPTARRPRIAGRLATALAGVVVLASTAAAQTPSAATAPDPTRLTVERIFGRGEFSVGGAPELQWMRGGRAYVEVRPAAGGGTDIVRVDAATGAATVLVPASALRDDAGRAILIEDLQLSPDEQKALLFHNSVRVWRTNTRGTFHVVDFATHHLTPIATVTTPGKPGAAAANAPSAAGAAASSGVRVRITVAGRPDTVGGQALGQRTAGVPAGAPSFIGRGLASGAVDADLQMFAKFSPDSRSVAYVRGNNLWVTELATGRATRLTYDGSDDVINGTTDWVYEEELGLRDAFRWSPDSRRIAYWRFDQSAVPAYPIVDATDGQYPTVSVLRYPKAGAPNSRVKVGVVAAAGGGPTRWLAVGPDTGQYVAQMEWLDADSIAVLRMPRRQNRLDVLLASATTGGVRGVVSDEDSAYVDVEGSPVTWIDGGRRFLLRSDRTGWRGFHLYDRSGRAVRQVTPDGADYLEIAGVDSARGLAYVSAAAPTPTQRNLYRCALAPATNAAPACVRLTAADGTHSVEIAPGNAYAIDTYSTAARPPVASLLTVAVGGDAAAALRPARVLEDNAAVAARLAALGIAAPQFFRLPMPDGTLLDAYRIVPAHFDSAARHPVLMHVYGGPAAPQVSDAWSGSRLMWHQLLAQQGYIVVVVDNRGAAWRGRAFRKGTQGRLGVQESQDQIDAARWIARQTWAEPTRIGLWGWSYGGYMTALTLARGGAVFKAGIAVAPVVDWRFYDSIYTERYMWTPQANPNGYQASA
ncbi:MAG TPA: DPP IV N-terminal domain-containing protein, partial [Gemmatirosa sp.]